MAHYYKQDGTPAHFEGKNGQATTLREARKLNLLPSVTTIISDILRKPQLESWRIEQGIIKGLAHKQEDNETEHDYIKRIKVLADQESQIAMSKGTEIHSELETGKGRWAEEWQKVMESAKLRVSWQERTLVAADYAGKADIMIVKDNRFFLCDFKGQVWDDKKPRIYSDWAYQLAAYKSICEKTSRVDGCASIVFNRDDATQWHIYYWDGAEIDRAWEVFVRLKDIWFLVKNYTVKAQVAA